MRLLCFLLLLPVPLWAQNFPLLSGDQVLSPTELRQLTERPVVEFFEGGQSRYSVGGSYSYTYQGGGTAYGEYTIEPDGVICIAFRNGRSRCDRFVQSHGRVVMITETGDRWPIRP